jgi:hypothetical protein
MKVLDKPDLDLIKQEDQGCGRFGNVECVHPARGRMKVATDAGVLLLICCRSSSGELALQ